MTDEEFKRIVPNNRDPEYGEGFFKYTELDHGWSNVLFGHILALLFRPASVVEFGCGTGGVLHGLRQQGVETVHGIEGSAACRGFIARKDKELLKLVEIHDLRRPWRSDAVYDLAVSIEVLEHLPEEAADTVAGSLCLSANRLVITTCPPTGRNFLLHLNEQPMSYWTQKFVARGFEEDTLATSALRSIMRAYYSMHEARRYPVIPTWFFSSSFCVFQRVAK